MFNLTGKVVIVAGGAGYLGGAVCRGMVKQGASVVVADLDLERAEQLVKNLNAMENTAQCLAHSLDLREETSIDALIGRVCTDLGRLDVLVNAIYAPHGPDSDEITPQYFTESLGSNVTGGFVLARQAKTKMTNGGSVIFFSSMYGRVAPDPRVYEKPMLPNPIEYGVAKAGIEQMIRYLAVSWAPEGIRVNGVSPGAFPNPMIQKAHPDFVKRLANKVPMGRIGKAEEIVGAVVFLASDTASYVTGQIIVVDGGWMVW